VLDVSLDRVSFSRGGFALRDVTLTFAATTHTAITGPPSCGASTLLDIIAGRLKPSSGEVRIGTRVVNDLSASRRPLLFVTSQIDVPERWSVSHALIAAVRQRSLDRVDRQHEYNLALEKWRLEALADRALRTLSSSERTRVHLARIELLRPGILLADRLLTGASDEWADTLFRTLRVAGTTVISAPANRTELGATDRVVILDRGRVVQEGTAGHVYSHPSSTAAAIATGEVNAVPVRIARGVADSAIGSWPVTAPDGAAVALVRPEAFSVAAPGEESDLIVAIEEASFQNGRWLVSAILTGGFTLRVSLPPELLVHKGKLLALRYDPAGFTIEPDAAAV